MTVTPLIGTAIYVLLIAIFLMIIEKTALGKRNYDDRPKGSKDPLYDQHSKWHAIGCFFACVGAMWMLHVPWPWGLGLTIAGGIGYELVNGFFSKSDVLWDAGGALVASFFHPDWASAQSTYVAGSGEPYVAYHWTVKLFWIVAVLVAVGIITWIIKRNKKGP